jgi:CheY-like chemotaxis protein
MHRRAFILPSPTASSILLAEDEPNDVILLRIAMEKAGLSNPLYSVPDGMEALEYLNRAGRCAENPMPRLLLLDLKMPRLDGFGVLEWMLARPEFSQIVKIVLTSSNLQSDMEQARNLGADEYLVKPTQNRELAELLSGLKNRWLLEDDALPRPNAMRYFERVAAQ